MSESDLKDVCVVLYEVLDGPASVVVRPVRLEQRGAEHDPQVVRIHLVPVR